FTSPIAEPPPAGWPSDRPAPYDVQAQEVTIQLEDTPMGFYLDSSATIEPSATLLDIGFANGYETLLYNNDDIFVSHFAVGSLAYVFMSPEGAELLHEAALAVYLDDPEYRQLSVPSIGDETSAFVSQSTIEGFLVEYFVVVAR